MMSPQEQMLEDLLLARILKADPKCMEIARTIARAEARRLYHIAVIIIDHLRDARGLLDDGLYGGGDAELVAVLFDIKDDFETTIASELLAWRGAVMLAHHHRHSVA